MVTRDVDTKCRSEMSCKKSHMYLRNGNLEAKKTCGVALA